LSVAFRVDFGWVVGAVEVGLGSGCEAPVGPVGGSFGWGLALRAAMRMML
jgi:hypothetical protein